MHIDWTSYNLEIGDTYGKLNYLYPKYRSTKGKTGKTGKYFRLHLGVDKKDKKALQQYMRTLEQAGFSEVEFVTFYSGHKSLKSKGNFTTNNIEEYYDGRLCGVLKLPLKLKHGEIRALLRDLQNPPIQSILTD